MASQSPAHLEVDGVSLKIEVRRYARSRTYRLRVDAPKQRVILSIPIRADAKKALLWAREQDAWVSQQLLKAPSVLDFEDGVTFPFEGRDIRICWATIYGRSPVLEDNRLMLGGPQEAIGRRVEAWLKERALHILRAESYDMAEGAGLRVASVSIGDPRSRWGSCTSSGALRYSWRLICAPAFVRQAIVAHEVAHLKHMNHGADFHALHRALLGDDPALARAWLKKHGSQLHLLRPRA